MATGTLVLVPNTLDLGAEAVPLDDALPTSVLRRAATITHWAVEDARSARVFLKRVAGVVALARPLQELAIVELPRRRKGSDEPVAAAEWQRLLAPTLAGHDLGLLSEAGLPAVADPGAFLVEAAHHAGVPVLPLAGPSSLMLALAASGLDGQSFAFVGYLPQDAAARTARIRELEALSRRLRQTQIAIETPYRNAVLIDSLIAALAPATRLAVSCGLTSPSGWTRSGPVADWRARPQSMPDRVPAVFAWLAR